MLLLAGNLDINLDLWRPRPRLPLELKQVVVIVDGDDESNECWLGKENDGGVVWYIGIPLIGLRKPICC